MLKSNGNKATKGEICEKSALSFFQKKGWELVAKNQRLEGVEVDLILEKPDSYMLVEVKSDNLWRREHPLQQKTKKQAVKSFLFFL